MPHQRNRSTGNGSDAATENPTGDAQRQAPQGWQRCFIALEPDVALMDIRSRGSDPVYMMDEELVPDHGETPFCAAERDELERAIAKLPPVAANEAQMGKPER